MIMNIIWGLSREMIEELGGKEERKDKAR